jgi:phage baseplate assembly protein W
MNQRPDRGADFLGVGWSFPVVRGEDGRISAAAYEERIRQSIHIILSTAKGERVMRPDFGCGLQELVFAANNATTQGLAEAAVEEALIRWEPRITLERVRAETGGERGEALMIGIDYRVRSTDNRFNLVYPFYLDRGTP